MKNHLLALGLLALTPTAHAVVISYGATLTGTAEAPPNASPGTGTAVVTLDTDLQTLTLDISFTGLIGTTTASHIHAPTTVAGTGTAGVATTTPTFAGFPLGVTSGAYLQTLDMTLASSYNSAYVTANGGTVAGAYSAFTSALAGGNAYLNIHSSAFPGGEIRGFLTPVPEPAASALAACGVGMLFVRRRRLTQSC